MVTISVTTQVFTSVLPYYTMERHFKSRQLERLENPQLSSGREYQNHTYLREGALSNVGLERIVIGYV
jgi:hypothetical protein